MTPAEFVPALLAAVIVLWALGAYNRLVRLRNAIHAGWAQIDEQLRRRRDALPRLVGALREPLAAEHRTLDAVLDAQRQVQAATDAAGARPLDAHAVEAFARHDAVLASAVERLLALLAQQPALREHADIGACLRELHDSDLRLAFARQWFNDAVGAYNAALAQFPTRLLRPLFGFGPARRL